MGFLNDIAADDARYGFFSTDDFGETVTVTKTDGTMYTCPAVVDRSVLPNGDEQLQGVKEVMEIEVENHATRGISSSAFDAGKWRVTVAYRVGEAAKVYTLGLPVSIDAGHIRFRVK